MWDPVLWMTFNSSGSNVTVGPSMECERLEPEVQLPLALKIILGASLLIMILLSTLGNSVVCFIVHRKPVMRSAINLLLANMALSNILLGILVMPFAFVTLITDVWIMGDITCRIIGFLQTLFTSETVIMLLIISVDRYLIIVHTRDRLTPTRARYIIGITWIYSCFISFPPTVGWGMYTSYAGWIMCVLQEHQSAADKAYMILYYIVIFVAPISVFAFSYLAIVKTIHQKSLRIHNHPDEFSSAGRKLGISGAHSQRLSVDLTFKMRAFKTIFILVLMFIVCWTPYGTALTLWNVKQDMAGHYLGGTIVIWIGYMNGALNPVIFCWRIKKFRDVCSEMVPRSLQIVPSCSGRARRRINPGTVYERSDSQPAQLQELQVQSYLTAQLPSTSI